MLGIRGLRYLQIPENTLRSWVAGRSCPCGPARSLRPSPVIELADRANSRLSFQQPYRRTSWTRFADECQVELPQIRRAVNYLREHFQSAHPLVHHEMLTDGKHLFVEAAGNRMSSMRLGSQLAMRDLIGLHLQRVEWDKDGFVARLYPFTRSRRGPADEASQPRVVTMDPRVEFGRPILKVSAVPTAVIADRWRSESIADLADDYGEDPLNIEEAVATSSASESRLSPSYSSSIDRWAGRRCPRHSAPPVSSSASMASSFLKEHRMLTG
ncbi:MAG: hypothetical protein R2712_23840 [Vicinamibacterales bacterium]